MMLGHYGKSLNVIIYSLTTLQYDKLDGELESVNFQLFDWTGREQDRGLLQKFKHAPTVYVTLTLIISLVNLFNEFGE